MTLPVPNLDDRRFQDIVDEAKRLLSTNCPEWTSFEPSDPGVALVEVFAWVAEMVLYRLNQVPDAFYLRMLDLMGVQRFPARAAVADITFFTSGPITDRLVVPAGTEVATVDVDPVVFVTSASLELRPPGLVAAMAVAADARTAEPAVVRPYGPDELGSDMTAAGSSGVAFETLTPGDAFYVGFDRSQAGAVLRLEVRCSIEGIAVDPKAPPIEWEAWNGFGWVTAEVERDTTDGLQRDGAVALHMPRSHEPLSVGGVRAFWLRVRLVERGGRGYSASPRLRSVTASCIGGTTEAEHSRPVAAEELGVSDGRPGQRFAVSRAPVLPRRPDERIRVASTAGDLEYAEVASFVDSSFTDLHVVWDDVSGEICFGPRIRYPDGSTRQHGAVPPAGATVSISGYRTGGGAEGNVGAGTLTVLRQTVPYVVLATNRRGARGGVDAETIEELRQRGPLVLSAGDRAVTAADHERLTLEADPSIARVRCLPPDLPGGPVRLAIVPRTGVRPGEGALDDFALPSSMIERVRTRLEERRVVGSVVEVGTPYYTGVSVVALVKARWGRMGGAIRGEAIGAIGRFLDPVAGGYDGAGWPFDVPLQAAAIARMLESLDGVDRVEDVVLFEVDLTSSMRIGAARSTIDLPSDSLFLPWMTQVVVR